MIVRKCKICGKEFKAETYRNTLCSDECRRTNKYNSNKKYQRDNKETVNKYHREYYHKNRRVIKYCEKCGCELPNACQKTCITCILKQYKYNVGNERQQASHLLNCRGYDLYAMWREIDERGI